jgi:hypothetical protein
MNPAPEEDIDIRYYFNLISEPTPPDPPTAVDELSAKHSTLNAKRLVNGHLLIEHNGKIYNASGVRIE